MRTNDGGELFRRLDTLQVFRQVAAGGNTTLAAAATAGQATANLTSNTAFTANDPVFIKSALAAELNAITNTTPTTAVPLLYKLSAAQPSAATVVEMVASSLAHISEDGIDFGGTAPINDVFSALASGPIAFYSGNASLEGSFALLGFNAQNFQTWMGAPELEIGTGVSADPFQFRFHSSTIATEGVQCLRATGILNDGRSVIVDFIDVRIAPSGTSKMNRQTPTGFPCSFKYTGLNGRIWT